MRHNQLFKLFLHDINDYGDNILTDMCKFIAIHILLDGALFTIDNFISRTHLIWVQYKTLILRVYLYRLYHRKVDSIHQYDDYNNIKYITFFLPYYRTYFLNSGLNSKIMYMDPSSSFNNKKLSSGISAFI